jgi:GH24 family phage-related lysozyme (muramidase)
MSAAATELTLARLVGAGGQRSEEGVKLLPYDDATGLPVIAPKGNLSWGIGFNLMKCGSAKLFSAMMRSLLEDIEAQLVTLFWYSLLPDPIQSVCQDIAYNGGVHDLLNYPHMIAAFEKGDWESAATQCTEKDPKIDTSRYAPLRAIIRSCLPPAAAA